MKKNFFSLSFLLLLLYLCACNNSDTGTATQNETQTAPEVKSVFINGDSLHYIDIGKGDPVVFVHGMFGDYRTWGAQMDTFAQNHRVIAYSCRYAFPNNQIMDSTASTAGYSVSDHAKDLAEFIKALNLQPAHVVGHSWGAYIALVATMDHPELVRSLTLGEPGVWSLLGDVPGGDTILNNFGTAFMPAEEAFKINDKEKGLKLFFAAVMGDSLYFTNLPQGQREIMMANIKYRSDAQPITCDDVKKIKAPVLLLQGDRSPLILPLIIGELERCLTKREKVTIPNSSHGLEYDNPVEFNKVVLGFIDKN